MTGGTIYEKREPIQHAPSEQKPKEREGEAVRMKFEEFAGRSLVHCLLPVAQWNRKSMRKHHLTGLRRTAYYTNSDATWRARV